MRDADRTSLRIETMPSWEDEGLIVHTALASRALACAEATSWRELGKVIEMRGGRIWHWLIQYQLRLDVKMAMMLRMVMHTEPGILTTPLETRGERSLACYLLAEELEDELALAPPTTPEAEP